MAETTRWYRRKNQASIYSGIDEAVGPVAQPPNKDEPMEDVEESAFELDEMESFHVKTLSTYLDYPPQKIG